MATANKKEKSVKKNLVIVESPAKAKTIKKFLGSSYKIEASMGHVRDLPKSQMGIDIENDFEPKYITIRGKGELLSKLRKEAKSADKVYLATDPDREGEAISWHLITALNLDEKDVSRITFNEITKNAVKKSIKEARDIDMDLVNAQQARRVLDRVVGYTISPLLWQKVKKGLSAGRVQSVALRIICDREEEINSFIPEEYWSIEAILKDKNNKKIATRFVGTKDGKIELKSKDEVDKILSDLENCDFVVDENKKGTRVKNPIAPFTTSTLQQEASKHLNMTTQKTMMVAQQLYEGVDIQGEGTVGLVSYIRTDSVRISDEAYEDAKSFILGNFPSEYLNPERAVYKSKGKTQDAHEAIRPTNASRTPDSIKESLTKEQYKLYKLIWERFIASQMAPAVYETQSIKIFADKYVFRASGSVIKFKGFLEVYDKNDDEKAEGKIPEVEKGTVLKVNEIVPAQHFTQPPPRFTDASLVKTLEEIGVGRPSTYAPTLTIIQSRNYVVKEAKMLYPTELGEVVNDVMKMYFPDIVDIDFTAHMEDNLDQVELGKQEWKQIIRDFYPDFSKAVADAQEKLSKVEIKDEVTDVICDKCGRNMVVKYGKYGKFLACPGFPECQNAKPFFEDAGVLCPQCGGKVQIKKTKKGRKYFGCENNPECDFMSWNKPTGEKCPQCGSYMVEKGTKNPKIVCSNVQCGYIEESKK
ncbi:MAG TPA: type I DNA topoisomerase [Candidatus Fimicola cottocaccae]|nr:type I DNA topoisomerase [Candidatus Fimicola cottocaccae]